MLGIWSQLASSSSLIGSQLASPSSLIGGSSPRTRAYNRDICHSYWLSIRMSFAQSSINDASESDSLVEARVVFFSLPFCFCFLLSLFLWFYSQEKIPNHTRKTQAQSKESKNDVCWNRGRKLFFSSGASVSGCATIPARFWKDFWLATGFGRWRKAAGFLLHHHRPSEASSLFCFLLFLLYA